MNILPAVANLLGVKQWQCFNIIDSNGQLIGGSPYMFNDKGLVSIQWPDIPNTDLCAELLNGDCETVPIESTEEDKLCLCYVSGYIMYFTDDMTNVWGDDWDDRPFEYNAGEPYKKYVKAKICYDNNDSCALPNRFGNFSAEDINDGFVPWLQHEKAGSLYAGATLEDTKVWLRKAGIQWGELHE